MKINLPGPTLLRDLPSGATIPYAGLTWTVCNVTPRGDSRYIRTSSNEVRELPLTIQINPDSRRVDLSATPAGTHFKFMGGVYMTCSRQQEKTYTVINLRTSNVLEFYDMAVDVIPGKPTLSYT